MEKGHQIVNSGGYRVYLNTMAEAAANSWYRLNSYMVLGVTIKRELSCADRSRH